MLELAKAVLSVLIRERCSTPRGNQSNTYHISAVRFRSCQSQATPTGAIKVRHKGLVTRVNFESDTENHASK